MNKYLLLFVFVFLSGSSLKAQDIKYDDFFTDEALRLDMYHFGTLDAEDYSLKSVWRMPKYSGPEKTLFPGLYGEYVLNITTEDGSLIFSKPYSTLFEEWQDSDMVGEGPRVFQETRFIPFPRQAVDIEIYTRRSDTKLVKIWEFHFDPQKNWYRRDYPAPPASKLISGADNIREQVDVAIVAEGYTADEMDDFEQDAAAFVKEFLETPPFDQHKEDFSFRIVKAVSEESGCDLPGINIWKNSIADARFYTLGSERYLTTLAYHNLMDIVSTVPHDQVILLVNTEKYGGGGIFNHFSVVSAHHSLSKQVLAHEFGHAFGGLADEYYTSSTAYVRHPDTGYEWHHPNVTTLVNFDSKWKHMVHDTVPIPTPDIEEYDNTVGAFEGGRYLEKGVYRPYRNCRMRSTQAGFCPVCQSVLTDIIDYYSGR